MKKAISLFLALALCLSLCACNSSKSGSTTTKKPVATNKNSATKPSNSTTTPSTKKPSENKTNTDADTDTDTNKQETHVHEWAAANCTKPKTCLTCGETEGTAAGHDWQVANCAQPKTCKICGKADGEKGNHAYQDATCTAPKTCRICGQKSGEALGCTSGDNGNCIRCGKSMIKISDVLSQPMDDMSEIKRFVSSYYTGDCYKGGNYRLIFNSANGMILSWGATNTSNKEIKYITFTINYYNRVGDPAYDSITEKSSYTARMTGPIGAGKSFYFRGLIGYGSDVYYGVITNIKIEYMDGTTVSGNYGYTTWHNIRTGASPKECFIIEA